MKKVTLILLVLVLALGATGGYGYFVILNDSSEDQDVEENSGSNSYPIARISPSNPKVQVNETIVFSASDSTDSDGDELSFTWTFEGDTMQYEGETFEKKYDKGGSYSVVLSVSDGVLTDETQTTVTVVEDYSDEEDGTVQEGDSVQISFPVQEGALSVYITWDLEDAGTLSEPCLPSNPCSVNLFLNDSEGNTLENETNEQEGQGSWSLDSERLDSVGDYDLVIEGENGSIYYEVTIDVSY